MFSESAAVDKQSGFMGKRAGFAEYEKRGKVFFE